MSPVLQVSAQMDSSFEVLSVRDSQIKVPTLMVVGEEDMATPMDKAKRIAEKIPGAKPVVIPHADIFAPWKSRLL